VKPVCFTTAAADQIAIYRFLEIPFGNRKKDLRKGRRGLIINIKHPEWIKIERLNLRTALLEKPADNT
jgi:hypothetical protein